jgi:hypothetical protein
VLEWLNVTPTSSEHWLGIGPITDHWPITFVLIRLVTATLLGGMVAWVYRSTRDKADVAPSFTATLVLLSVLIAMVTQVIGDNVARAFSLVGALSIVRFRTVVRDTEDTAYVIFAVVVGMAMGAGNIVVGVLGLVVVGIAAWIMRRRARVALPPVADLPFELTVRLALGGDPEAVLGPTLSEHKVSRRLALVSTARQGLAMDIAYRAALGDESLAAALVTALNRLDGVQGVTLQRATAAET